MYVSPPIEENKKVKAIVSELVAFQKVPLNIPESSLCKAIIIQAKTFFDKML